MSLVERKRVPVLLKQLTRLTRGFIHTSSFQEALLRNLLCCHSSTFYLGLITGKKDFRFKKILNFYYFLFLASEHDASPASDSFLRSMRMFMPRGHRAFLEHIEGCASLRPFVIACNQANIRAKEAKSVTSISYAGVESTETNEVDKLLAQYDDCLRNMAAFRGSHMKLVAEYIIAQQKHGIPSKNTIGATAGGKGTGGTDLMKFLKPIRDNISNSVVASAPGDTGAVIVDNEEPVPRVII